MTREESMRISGIIGRAIAETFPRIRYRTADVERFLDTYTVEEQAEMREIGLLGDPDVFFVIHAFLEQIGLSELPGEYLLPLFRQAKRLDADAFRRDPYITAVPFDDVHDENIFLTTASYARGEIFQYDMPDMRDPAGLVIPKLGFFDRTVRFPTIYEGTMPWMSACPSEIHSMRSQMEAAHGKVLVLGLGLGYYPFLVSHREEVEHLTVIELNPRILRLFETHLFPHFDRRDKITLVEGDAIAYLDHVQPGDYDFVFADIWEGAVDGAPLYEKIKPHERRLPGTEFTYWIEDQIRAYLAEEN